MSDAILFDMDGVLLEGRGTDPAVYEAAADAVLADLELEPTPDQRRVLRGYRYSETVAETCESLGIDPGTFWSRRERHASRIANERFRDGDRGPYDDVDAIHELAGRATLGLVSNNRHETVEFVAEHLGLATAFDVVRGRDPTIEGYRRRKPDSYYVADALADLGASGGFYVGDRETDVEAARAAGLEPVFVRRPHNRDAVVDPDVVEIETLAALSSILE